jgi:hypothetical protein
LHLNILFQGFLYSFYNNHVFETTIPFLHTIKIPDTHLNQAKTSITKSAVISKKSPLRNYNKHKNPQETTIPTKPRNKNFKIKKTFEAEKEYPAEKSNLYPKKKMKFSIQNLLPVQLKCKSAIKRPGSVYSILYICTQRDRD